MQIKKLKKNILISTISIFILFIAWMYFYKYQGQLSSMEIDLEESQIYKICFTDKNSSVELIRNSETWELNNSDNESFEADSYTVEELIGVFQNWEIKEMRTSSQVLSDSNIVLGNLKVVKKGLFNIPLRAADYIWVKTDSGIYIKSKTNLYSKIYCPGVDRGWERLFSTNTRVWKNKWIFNYYHHEIYSIEWVSSDMKFVYKADTNLKTSDLSAFKSVYFDKIVSDTGVYKKSLAQQALSIIKVEGTDGNKAEIEIYEISSDSSQTDMFNLCGILKKECGKSRYTDTIVFSYLLYDRMHGALKNIALDENLRQSWKKVK